MVASKWDTAEDIPDMGCQDAKRLIELFRYGNEKQCGILCDILVRLPDTKLSHLLNALNDPDDYVRKWVVITIGRSGERSKEMLLTPNLVQILDDRSQDLREAAHQALIRMLNAVLLDRNRAENEFNRGVLRDTLMMMLKSGCESARETAYAFMQDILSEDRLAKTIGECLRTAKGEAYARIKPYYERAMRDLILSVNGFDEKDKRDLLEKGFLKNGRPDDKLPKKRRNFVN